MLLEANLSRCARLGAHLSVCFLLFASPGLLHAQGNYGYGSTAASGYGNTSGFNNIQAQPQAQAPTDAYTAQSANPNAAVFFDQPTANSKMPKPPHGQPELSDLQKGLLAACWYIPNRIMDLTDIPRFHLALGDGVGLSLRATQYLTASYYQCDTYCIGWTRRTQPWFGQKINERYLGFLAAHEGKLERDPTEVGFSMQFIILGVNAAFSLGEAADAAAGLIGIDLMGDDHGPALIDRTPQTPDPTQLELQRAVYGPQPAAVQPGLQPGAPAPASAPVAPSAPASPPTGAPITPDDARSSGSTAVPPPTAPSTDSAPIR